VEELVEGLPVVVVVVVVGSPVLESVLLVPVVVPVVSPVETICSVVPEVVFGSQPNIRTELPTKKQEMTFVIFRIRITNFSIILRLLSTNDFDVRREKRQFVFFILPRGGVGPW